MIRTAEGDFRPPVGGSSRITTAAADVSRD
jgi:hypothetical protein